MEYFTLKDDFEEIQAGKAKARKRIFISLAIIVLLVLMRATGVLTLEYHKAYFQGNHSVQKWILETGEAGMEQDFKLNRIETDAEDFNWKLGLDFKFLPSVPTNKTGEYAQDKQYLEELIEKKLDGERNLNNRFEIGAVSVEKLEMTGLYWFPLIKNGESSYRISVASRDFPATYSASFSGKIDLQVHGFCTIDRLKKDIAEKIAKTVVDSIKDDYKK